MSPAKMAGSEDYAMCIVTCLWQVRVCWQGWVSCSPSYILMTAAVFPPEDGRYWMQDQPTFSHSLTCKLSYGNVLSYGAEALLTAFQSCSDRTVTLWTVILNSTNVSSKHSHFLLYNGQAQDLWK